MREEDADDGDGTRVAGLVGGDSEGAAVGVVALVGVGGVVMGCGIVGGLLLLWLLVVWLLL